MAEKIEVGVVVKGAGKAATDINKVGTASKNLGTDLKGNNFIVDQLTGSLDQMTGGAFSGFKKAATGLKTFISGLKTTKSAIIATGIGALVIAFGLLVTYWDDIKVLVNGVSSEQKILLKYAEDTRDAAQEQLNITNQSEASLRLAGKSEREILNLKIQQTNEVILATEAILTQQKLQKEAQVEAARRNQEIAAGVLAFLQLPITMLLGAVDALTYGLSKVGAIEEATNLVEEASKFQASFLFNPETIEEEGDAVIEETENILRKLQNSRDGFTLEAQERDAAAAQAKIDADAEIARQKEEVRLAKVAADAENASAEEDAKQAVTDADSARMETFFSNLEAISKGDEQATIKRLKELKKTKDAEEATAKAVRSARLDLVSAAFDALGAMAKTEEQQKKLAIAQILVNQGIALSNAIAGALQSATGTGPAAVFTAPGFTATLIGLVLSSFASVKGVMDSAGAATDGLETTMPSSIGNATGQRVGETAETVGNQLALTPGMVGQFGGNVSTTPIVQAYILQSNIAYADALQTELQNQASL